MVLTDSDLVFKLKSLPAELRGGLLAVLGGTERASSEDLLKRLRQSEPDRRELPAE